MNELRTAVNRFVYRVYCEYQGASSSARLASLNIELQISRRLSLLPAELLRYLPDRGANVSAERAESAPNVIQIVVLTKLDEATTDAAFVEFIKQCNRAGWIYRIQG